MIIWEYLLDIIGRVVCLTNRNIHQKHFFNNKNIYAPVARFVPNLEGWEMAIKLANVL
jgi:hypothetical protein